MRAIYPGAGGISPSHSETLALSFMCTFKCVCLSACACVCVRLCVCVCPLDELFRFTHLTSMRHLAVTSSSHLSGNSASSSRQPVQQTSIFLLCVVLCCVVLCRIFQPVMPTSCCCSCCFALQVQLKVQLLELSSCTLHIVMIKICASDPNTFFSSDHLSPKGQNC